MTVTRDNVLDLLVSRTRGEEPEALIAEQPAEACLKALAEVSDVRPLTCPSLAKLYRVSSMPLGHLVVQCLRSYEEYRANPDRALAAVYSWARLVAPLAFRAVLHSESDLTSAFSKGKAATAKMLASELYGDCYLMLAEHVTEWNRSQVRVA